jgi:SAM-dependent methyltransferase
VLEVGCGHGELARELDAAGYEVVAIDPDAPRGPIFRSVALEELDEAETYDAAVAVRSLHHVHDLGAALDKLARLAPLLVLDEFTWDRLDAPTADWYRGQARVLRAEGHDPQELGTAEEWAGEHAGLHGYETIRRELRARYEERHFAWTPYLYRYLGAPATEELERSLIAAGAIQALGFRYVGERATTRSAPASR